MQDSADQKLVWKKWGNGLVRNARIRASNAALLSPIRLLSALSEATRALLRYPGLPPLPFANWCVSCRSALVNASFVLKLWVGSFFMFAVLPMVTYPL